MKLERVIEVYRKKDECHINSYVINLDAEGILEVLDDLILNEDDWPEEIYDPYYLTESQVERLKPFLTEPLHTDFENNLYELMCYGVE
ncbi:hypothetical protein FXV77_05335 [Sphingobacterium phlebotomi]|uniref:DUF7683 domain-containing protein n=1 Tax=Sphingobacterium phlebotomi TaxID=2605433 RepID=A0A5D4H9W6_9SPHI|nr:hypothetical protein [Sphingobacterium phlebotomi]TYR37428.1 hypothetical protein FXV77_05335 [Sphingobacterium phlebotomi]